jgi:flagellar M-ring protein FliF
MAAGSGQLEKIAPKVGGTGQFSSHLSTLWTRGRVQWASMQPAQRRWSLIGASLLAILMGGIFWYGLRTEWRTLYAGLDPEDARQIGLTLTQAQIPFDVQANGTAILVPAPLLDKARLATAAKGGMKSGRLGFELFDKPNWVGSEFDEQVNYQRALEGELEHTAGTLADVESASAALRPALITVITGSSPPFRTLGGPSGGRKSLGLPIWRRPGACRRCRRCCNGRAWLGSCAR